VKSTSEFNGHWYSADLWTCRPADGYFAHYKLADHACRLGGNLQTETANFWTYIL